MLAGDVGGDEGGPYRKSVGHWYMSSTWMMGHLSVLFSPFLAPPLLSDAVSLYSSDWHRSLFCRPDGLELTEIYLSMSLENLDQRHVPNFLS